LKLLLVSNESPRHPTKGSLYFKKNLAPFVQYKFLPLAPSIFETFSFGE